MLKMEFEPQMIRTATAPKDVARPSGGAYGAAARWRAAGHEAWSYAFCLSRTARIFMADLIVVSGMEKHSGLPVKTLFLGESEQPRFSFGKAYLEQEAIAKHGNFMFAMDGIYSDFNVVERIQNISVIKAIRLIARYEQKVDLIFLDLEAGFSRLVDHGRYWTIPKWVPQKLFLADTWPGVLATFRKNLQKELRRVLKRGYQYVASRSEIHFRQFYDEMYVGYTQKRFDRAAVVYSKKHILNCLRDGEILFVLQNGRVLVGVLNRYEQGRMASICSAAADGLKPDMIKGAFTAMDYFSILNAFERGCRTIDFLGSRPLLEDGPFRYKRKWGTVVEKFSKPIGDFHFRACRFNPGVISFLVNNPLIVKQEGKLVGRVFLAQPTTDEDVERCLSRYGTSGLDTIETFCTAGMHRDAREEWRSQTTQVEFHDLSTAPFPEMARRRR